MTPFAAMRHSIGIRMTFGSVKISLGTIDVHMVPLRQKSVLVTEMVTKNDPKMTPNWVKVTWAGRTVGHSESNQEFYCHKIGTFFESKI